MVQTVQKFVKFPHAFLDMVVDRWRMVETVQNCGVSAVGAAPLCLCRRPSQQRRLFLRFMDYEQCWRRRPCCVELLCVVCPRECGARFCAHEVLRLFFCERRMRCGCVWCSSYSTQWTGSVPRSCFLDVDVPVLATSWGSRGSAAAVPRLVCQLIMAMMSS